MTYCASQWRRWSTAIGNALVVVCVVAGSAPSMLSAQSTDQGYIDVQSARLLDTGAGWELFASAEVQLSPEMRQGLNSGVPLQFIVDFRIKRARSFWPDKTLLANQLRYSLIYYELTRHYRLQSLATGKSRNYRSLLAALDELGQLQGLSLQLPEAFANVELKDGAFKDGEFENSGELFGYLSIRLDDKALPLPLQPLFSSTWKLASEDFAWSLN